MNRSFEHLLLDDVSEETTSPWVAIDVVEWPGVTAVISVEATGTVVVQGRHIGDDNEVDLHTAVTATGNTGLLLTSFPLMRAKATGVADGDVRVSISGVKVA